MYVLFWVFCFIVLCCVCLCVNTVQLPPGVKPIAVNKYIIHTHIYIYMVCYRFFMTAQKLGVR